MTEPNIKNFFRLSRGSQWTDLLESVRGWRFWRTQLTMLIGVSLNSFVINALILPHHIFTGGLTGIALVIYYLNSMLGLGWLYLLLNIPLFVLAWKKLSPALIVHSISGMLMFSVLLGVTTGMVLEIPNPIAASVIAGVMYGTGTGLYFRFGGSAGGLDLLAAYLRKTYSFPLGVTFNLANLFILSFALLFNDLMTTFYSALFIVCAGAMAQKVISGFTQRSAVIIITEAPHLIATEITKRLDRGVTFLNGSGGYNKQDKELIFTVLNVTETGRLKDLIYEIDENALITILNTDAVIGSKFLSWEDEGYTSKQQQQLLQDIQQEKQDLEHS